MPAPDNIFSSLIPGQGPQTGAVYGAPPTPTKAPALPAGWEPDPDVPGGIRPIKGGPEDPAAQGILGDQTKDFFAQQILTGAPMPSIGYGKEAARAKQDIMNRVAKMAGADGMNGTDFAAQIAHYKAGQTSISNMQKLHDNIAQAERAATLNGQQYLDRSNELPHQGGGPLLNTITQAWERNIPGAAGHDTVTAMDQAYTTFVGEYNRVVNGSPSGAGTMSDASRHEAMETFRKSADPSQKAAALAQMQKDMANRMDAINSVIADQYKNLTRRYDKYSIPDDPKQAQLPAEWIKAHPDSVAAQLAAMPKTPPSAGGDGGSNAPTDGGPGQVKASDLTPDQQKSYAAFWKGNPNPTPEQLTTFLGGIGINNVTNAADIIKAAKSGRGVSTTQIQTDYGSQINQRIKQEDTAGVGESNAGALAAQGSTLNLSDEAAGVGNALSNAIVAPFSSRENFDPVGSYTFGRDVERQRIANARQQLGYGGSAIEIGSSLATVNPAGALEAIAPRSAAAVGALAGYGNGEGVADSATQATGGALGGYAVGRFGQPVAEAVGKGIGKILPNALRTRILPPRGMAPDVAQAAQAEGVDLLRPMVDPASRGKYAQLESNPASQGTIRQGFNRTLGQIEDKVKSLGGGTAFAESDQAGQAAQAGGQKWLAARTATKNRLYRQAEDKAGSARFEPTDAIAEADANLAELKGNPNANAAEISFLQGYRDDLAAKGGKTVAEIRNLREGLRASINRNSLTMDGAGVRALRILNAAKGDIQKAVPDAANAYSRADQYYSASQGVVDDLEKTILGTRDNPIEPQVALKNLRGMMADTGTGRRYARIMQSLDSDTRQDIAATWASALGRDAPDAPFQLGKFLGQTKGLSPSALRTAFGPEGAESVKNLRILSQALKDSGSDVNYSRSGSVLGAMARRFLGGVTGLGTMGAVATHSVAGAGYGAAAGMALGAKSDVQAILSARAMVNPRVSRWLADVASVNNRTQAHAALRKLSVIIGREPALASELTPLYARISAALSQPEIGAMPLAAQPAPEGQQNEQQ